jgi:cysteine desulfurase family protein (TIGR01976 family)
MVDYLYRHNANAHWAFPTSEETDALLAASRATLADFLNASPAEVAFGPNMTTLTFHLARSLGRRLSPGDEIVVTELDHHGNVDPWKAVASERGLTIRTVRMVPETGQLDWNDLARCLQSRPKIVAIGAASNALGTITDIPRAVSMARQAGAIVFVDAVHYAAHRLVDVRDWDCDFLACSAYKFHGPHLGVLFGRRSLLETLDLPKLEPAPDSAPERLETGTQNHEGIVGAAAAVDFLAGLAGSAGSRRERLRTVFDTLHERGEALFERLWNGLNAIAGVRLYGPPPGLPRTPTLSFSIDDIPCEKIARRLADEAIFASHGNFYALTVARRLGRDPAGFVRLGCAATTTPDEVERVIKAIAQITTQA